MTYVQQITEKIKEVTIEEPPKEKKCIFNLGLMLGIRFFMVRNAKELHFAILDMFLKVLYKGGFYCFCD